MVNNVMEPSGLYHGTICGKPVRSDLPYVVYQEDIGVLSSHATRAEAETAWKKYLGAERRHPNGFISAIYQWRNDKWVMLGSTFSRTYWSLQPTRGSSILQKL